MLPLCRLTPSTVTASPWGSSGSGLGSGVGIGVGSGVETGSWAALPQPHTRKAAKSSITARKRVVLFFKLFSPCRLICFHILSPPCVLGKTSQEKNILSRHKLLCRESGKMALRKKLIYNTALLTGSSLLMNCIGMAFQIWLVGRIGTAGIGLYQLVCSVTALSATVAISGIRFACTRLVSEELGLENSAGIRGAMRRCTAYGLFFGAASAAILWFLAEPIGFLWVGDARTVLSLQISAFSMPCIALCSAFSGYFTAVGRVWKPALVHLAEQLSGIALVALFLTMSPEGDIEKSCAAVTAGRLAADLLSLLLMAGIYAADRRSYYSGDEGGLQLTGRMLRIALPLAVFWASGISYALAQ